MPTARLDSRLRRRIIDAAEAVRHGVAAAYLGVPRDVVRGHVGFARDVDAAGRHRRQLGIVSTGGRRR